jgi:thiamine transport system permease protein
LVALAIAVLIVLIFAAILHAASAQPAGSSRRPDIVYLVGITTLQATLSTLLSLVVGIALAWSLNRLRFPGRGIVVGLFASAIVTPGLIIAFGLISVWGRSGWLGTFNLPVFGLGGVVAAHIILDGAFVARILLARLDAIPEARLKTGQSLALSARQRFALVDWPAMQGTLPGLAAIIFLLAFTSFPIVLLLGGGPAVQTLEVAIYSAVRLDFDLSAAVTLALIQIAICAAIIIASAALSPVPISIAQSAPLRWRDGQTARAAQWAVLIIALLGFGLPLLSVLVDGLSGLREVGESSAFWNATLTSLLVAFGSAVLTLLLAITVGMARAASPSRTVRIAVGVPAFAYLAVPAVALSLGAFLFVRDLGIVPERAAPLVVVIANALLALPFALATLGPAFDAIVRSRGRLVRSLGLTGWRQWTDVEWPLLARDIGVVVGLSFCFSLGDLGVIALFGTQDFATLPLLMLRTMGAYRTHDAAAIAALMLTATTIVFATLPPLLERFGRARA